MSAVLQDTAPHATKTVAQELLRHFGREHLREQLTADGIPTLWVGPDKLHAVLRYLKKEIHHPYEMLHDLTAIDERVRHNRGGQPDSDYTVVYHLSSFTRNSDVRLKLATKGGQPSVPSITKLFANANWYEREAWDLFGIKFDGHPNLRRIMMAPTWEGHPLRKDHPARATEFERFTLPPEKVEQEQDRKSTRFVRVVDKVRQFRNHKRIPLELYAVMPLHRSKRPPFMGNVVGFGRRFGRGFSETGEGCTHQANENESGRLHTFTLTVAPQPCVRGA